MVVLTSNSSSGTAPCEVVDDHSIALHNSVNSEVAAVASVGDLTIFEHSHRQLHSIDSGPTVLHDLHSRPRSTGIGLAIAPNLQQVDHILVTRLKMDVLILNAVEASTCVNEDASNLAASLATLAGKHGEGSVVFVDDV